MAASNGGETFDDSANLEPIDKRKMFVGGLSLDTDEEDLKSHFGEYGPVMHAVVKRDPMTGRSRCFGFVTFSNSAAIKKVHEVNSHTIKGRRVDPKAAEPRQQDGAGDGIMKVFVGGLDGQMEDDDLKAYFEKFGPVIKLEWPRDRMRNNSKKNFAFVEFADEKVVNDVVRTPKQEIGGRMCDVRKAIPPAQKAAQQQNMMGGDRNSGWGDFGGGGAGFPGYDYMAAAAMYGGFGGFDPSSYYGYDPSSYFADPTMAAYYAAGYDMSGFGGAGYDTTGFAAAAAAAGYSGYGDGSGMRGGMGRGGLRGSSSAGDSTSPRGSAFGQKSGFGGAMGARGGSVNRGYHPYRR
ncbi:hypothetical protein RvY_05521 [Ramazzottius varieornatus]|uniref:RRM domain-containing protein n=1 Tax=Ramazzottius varieornatus TaxID=947166 RepID=A0A1D1V0W3_RAMVA|nr:hypothetical protein RvY_05521 [Ramazzottius varieornatus]